MGFVGSMLSNGKGAGWQAGTTQVDKPVSTDQTDAAYGQSRDALQAQQAFVGALQAQNGIGNQSSVFNQQQGLANQLQMQANGEGPNPAMAQLQQTTGQNVANQAAMMAGQRGASANVGLMARQAAMQGAATQQQAVGQGATMAAQQQIAAQQQLASQQQAMAGLATNQVGQQQSAIQGYNQAAQSEQQNLLNSIAQANNANVTQQSNMNNTNSAIANTNAQGQYKMTGGVMDGTSAAGILAGGGMVDHDGKIIYAKDKPDVKFMAAGGAVDGPPSGYSAPVPVQPQVVVNAAPQPLPAPAISAMPLNSPPPQGPSSNIGNILNGNGGSFLFSSAGGTQQGDMAANAGTANYTTMAPSQKGGKVPTKKSDGKTDDPNSLTDPTAAAQAEQAADAAAGNTSGYMGGGPGDSVGAAPDAAAGEASAGDAIAAGAGADAAAGAAAGGGIGGLAALAAQGGMAGLPFRGTKVLKGEATAKAMIPVPGKAKVKGNSIKNDTVPAVLSPGEIILPREVTQAKDAPARAAKFVQALLAKQGGMPQKAKK